MAELCEHQKTSGTWTVEVRPPEHECIFCHVERLESLLREMRAKLEPQRDDARHLAREALGPLRALVILVRLSPTTASDGIVERVQSLCERIEKCTRE
jgi:hypothetical protein